MLSSLKDPGEGCIVLCDLVLCPDPKIVDCLEALENILKGGDYEKKNHILYLFNASSRSRVIDDAGGLVKNENENKKIYEMTVNLLETYCVEDEDELLPPGDASQSGFQFGCNQRMD
ncbi:hypothetical protein V6N13_045910 [Hibiscus sabdariffa]|uniref:Uncharacterized protein n=1 Tax=Hibiscus sabdariffa TaxID=183260 RepID=A0ABR2AY40_9ROSI